MAINWDKINEQMLIYKDNSVSEAEREKALQYVCDILYDHKTEEYFCSKTAAGSNKRLEHAFDKEYYSLIPDAIGGYDPGRSDNFVAYFRWLFNLRKNNMLKRRINAKTDSLDELLPGDTGQTKLETMPSKEDITANIEGIDFVVNKLLLMAKTVRLKRKTAEGARAVAGCKYMSMFYTDTVCASVVDHMDIASPLSRHNADVFKAIDVDLLDYVTVEEYREIIKLVNARLKRMQDLPGLEMESGNVRLPLELKVYSAFMKNIGAPADISTISKRRDKYKEEWIRVLKED